MITFLEEIIDTLLAKHKDIDQLTIVLPSKRAGGFFKNLLRKKIVATTFLPRILSIEEFVESLSDLKIIDSSLLIPKSYQAYLQTKSISEKEPFETYATWIQTLLNDFNEIDRYLVETPAFFSYLSGIKSLEKWNVQNQQTELIANYLSFWESLPEFYENLQGLLLSEGAGYQGMVYRKAAEELEHYIATHGEQPHIFIGFNALNLSEQYIIKELLETGNSEIYFDADSYLLERRNHSAAVFMKQYFTSWQYFQKNPPRLYTNFEKQKHFKFIEVQKQIAQAKYVGQLLAGFTEDQLNNTAVVLADEALLIPLLYSLPTNINSVNITMGVPMKHLPASLFFASLLGIHQKQAAKFYFKEVFSILNNPTAALLLHNTRKIVQTISAENRTYLSTEELIALAGDENAALIELLFGNWSDNPELAITNCLDLIFRLREQSKEKPIDKALLFELYTIFTGLSEQLQLFPYLSSIKILSSLYNEAIASAALDFKGDAYQGLQIMGVLETRVLDFENVILTSVNEGVFPAGKSNASFITYDLKSAFNLPQYTDKDAIYTYHFYHLLHRATNIWLLYNNHSEGINTGEKSRFLLQLEVEKHQNHRIEKLVIAPKLNTTQTPLRHIKKTATVMKRIHEIAEKGFSPSALTAYIRNPLVFYLERVLKIKEAETMEETVDFNTLGTIVHNSLQHFYEPMEGKVMRISDLTEMRNNIHKVVVAQFEAIFHKGTFDKGKNLLIFEVAKRYIENMIAVDMAEIAAGNEIEILYIERTFKIPLPNKSIASPVHIQGMVDRVDRYNGTLRIIDYKTGNVQQGEVELVNWEDLTADYKYSKAFQVLTYALMIHSERPFENAEAGIISFKNLNSGFLKFSTKVSGRSQSKNQQITEEILHNFTEVLIRLIQEICDPEVPFTEKEV